MALHIPVLGRLSLAAYMRVFLAYSFLIVEPMLRILFAILPLRFVADFVRNRVASLSTPTLDDKVESNFLKLHSTQDFASHWYVQHYQVVT